MEFELLQDESGYYAFHKDGGVRHFVYTDTHSLREAIALLCEREIYIPGCFYLVGDISAKYLGQGVFENSFYKRIIPNSRGACVPDPNCPLIAEHELDKGFAFLGGL